MLIWWGGLALLGLAVGVVGGLFGIGGGFLLIPLLNMLFSLPIEQAVGTGICQTIGTAVAAFRRHSRLKQGEPLIDWLLMAGALLGVQGGAQMVETLSGLGDISLWGHPVRAVKLAIALSYVVLLALVAFWMLRDARARPAGVALPPGLLTRLGPPPFTRLPNSRRRVSIFVMAYLGLLLGFMAGMMGLGGGVALMPILIYGIGMRIRMAAGTGILLLVATAMAGTVAHARLGHVRLDVAMVLLAGSTLGAPFGATLAGRIDGRKLRGLFAYLLFLTALAVLWDLLRVVWES
jgi:uncharacterized membrane protein YfcA